MRHALKRLLNGRIVILLIAILTTLVVALIPEEPREGLPFWTTRTQHYDSFAPNLAKWNAAHPAKRVDMQMIHEPAFERRMLSGFLTGTPVADLLEASSTVSPKAFLDPLDQIGFYDMTDRLHAEGNGIYDAEALKPEALHLLQEKQDALKRMISRNVFLETAP